jgi:ABC-type multidrug transport system ATPase subunit
MLHRLKNDGISILISTSYMDEAALCDRVALIQKGNILSINTPQNIIHSFKKSLWAVKAAEMYELMNMLKKDPAVESCYPFGQYHHVTFKTETGQRQILETAAQQYTEPQFHEIEPGIEDCFMELMNEK